MLGIRKTAAIEPEAPPSLQEYERRLAEVEELAREAERSAVAAYRLETEVADRPQAEIDGHSFVMQSVVRGSNSRMAEARRAADDLHEAAGDARVALNRFSAQHKDLIWPPDPLGPMERAQFEADKRRRAQLAEDLLALGFTLPEAPQ